MVLWDGSCIVHEVFSEQQLVRLKARYPEAPVLAHPECEEAVLQHADYIGSTSGIRRFATESEADTFIVATESGILHQMQKDNPEKTFIAAPPSNGCACNDCPAHEAEHAGEALPLPEARGAGDRDGRGDPSSRPRSPSSGCSR